MRRRWNWRSRAWLGGVDGEGLGGESFFLKRASFRFLQKKMRAAEKTL